MDVKTVRIGELEQRISCNEWEHARLFSEGGGRCQRP